MQVDESVIERAHLFGENPWYELSADFHLSERVFFELLDGGQTFQWYRAFDHSETGALTGDFWTGVIDGMLTELRLSGEGTIQYRVSMGGNRSKVSDALRLFFRIDEDLVSCLHTMPTHVDSYLRRCVDSFPGLRILRQPIEKVVLTFLCSSNKQIPQIKQMLRFLSVQFGEEVAPGWYEYPKWNTLASAELESLQACRTGYRGKYILGSARLIAGESGYFEKLERLPYEEAKQKLLKLPGVGEKVADCILLYGAGRYEAFPLDTWILKALEARYTNQVKNLNREGLRRWAGQYFGPFAGLAQQYIFAYEREVKELRKRKM